MITKQAIKEAILSFDWSDYGLDEVEDADPEYAEHLAGHILSEAGGDDA